MKKIIMLLMFGQLALFAQTVEFKEGKFVEALELFTYRDGNVTYDENKTTVAYKDGKTIVKINNTVTVHNEKKELLTTINLLEKPEVGLYFSLTKALFQKDFEQLKENFEIEKLKHKKYIFTPKGDTKKVIDELELQLKEDDTVETFLLDFSNGDKIKIEAK